jgi:hypothetical protein
MAVGDVVAGRDCKAYYNTGTNATPTWVLMPKVRDLSVPFDPGDSDVSCRAGKFKLSAQALIESGVEFGYLHVFGDETVRDALIATVVSGTVREFAIMDALIATSKARGLRAFMVGFGMPHEQPLEGHMLYTFTFKPTYKEEPAGTYIEPSWYTIP